VNILTKIAKVAVKEKVIRVIIATFRVSFLALEHSIQPSWILYL
jgi:V-type H+-transporting ATPase subunit H